MPHQCTNCGRAFEDGSKEMLSGCPDCGGNKFQFRPATSDSTDTQSGQQQSQTRQRPADSAESSDAAQTTADAAASDTDPPSSSADTSADKREWPNTPDGASTTDVRPKSNRILMHF